MRVCVGVCLCGGVLCVWWCVVCVCVVVCCVCCVCVCVCVCVSTVVVCVNGVLVRTWVGGWVFTHHHMLHPDLVCSVR